MSGIKSNKPNPRGAYRQGYYKLTNAEKYVGDPSKIIYRSSWEYRFCRYCDHTPEVLKWSSEPVAIPYFSPLDEPGRIKPRNYYVDFYMRVKKGNETIDYLAEVKPSKSLQKPILEGVKHTTQKLKNYNYALQTWIVNRAKFSAAKQYAEKIGYKFILVTDEFLFGK
jgi:hypothetical protein